ncbi:hypothetical protein BV394_05680 [Brevirhabdus pacifica]|uniref:Uncharacterized protein n=1 Tax=Brevirhabdus pacifica TaxID=1267768 RepID=A0A1U7DGZ9_9RHOB|nr:hypothetical protein [Brevirhabdus pacifica]APX89270.1 hypothetical protein BV394_05680 [Brevirhabdus pacifica]PJJ86119.1 hypothetical protein CLV77_0654 [Brevirhabdus pacifica]
MNDHWFSKPTQIAWTCRALAMGRTLTHMDEIAERRGWRLGAIIHTLRVRYGWPIEDQRPDKSGVAFYRLVDGCNVMALDYPPSASQARVELKALGYGVLDHGAGGSNG